MFSDDDEGLLQFGVGFEAPSYSVIEGTPSQPGNSMDICVSSPVPVTTGVTVTVTSSGGTADGEFN